MTTPQRLLFFLAIFCVASFKLSFSLALTWAKRGFSFSSWGLMGPPGFFQNSGELAIQMAVFWPVALGVAIALKPYISVWKYRVLMLMPVTAGMVILGASSRGGQLALAIQVLMRFYRQIFRFKVLVGVVAVVTLGWTFLPDEQKQRFSESGSDKTSQQRLLYWENGYEMLNDYPMTGVGYFNFRPYFTDYYPEDMLYPHAELAHNIFIQVAADLGYPGLVIYVCLILSCLLMMSNLIKRMLQREAALPLLPIIQGFNISFVGFLVAGQFVSVVYYPFMWVHLALSAAVYNIFWEK